MIPLLVATLAASLGGSLHCAGMCGPLVGVYSGCGAAQGAAGAKGGSVWLAHTTYNLGRLVTYAALGAIAGAAGAAIDTSGSSLAGWQRASAVVAGLTIILWAIARHTPLAAHGARLPSSITRLLGRGLRALASLPSWGRGLGVGLLTGFLPCGWLYLFVLTSAGTGSVWQGALVMTAFWAGTVPILLGIGAGVSLLREKLRARLRPFATILLVALGLLTLAGRFDLAGRDLAPNDAAPTASVPDADVRPACCGGGADVDAPAVDALAVDAPGSGQPDANE